MTTAPVYIVSVPEDRVDHPAEYERDAFFSHRSSAELFAWAMGDANYSGTRVDTVEWTS